MSKRMINRLRVIGAWSLYGGFLVALLFVGDSVLAQTATDTFGLEQVRQGTGLGSGDIRTIIANIIRVALTLLGIIALAIFLYGGYLYMTAAGSEDKVSQARKLMINGVIGIAIILSAYAITSFIISRLSSATGFQGGGTFASSTSGIIPGGGNPCIGNAGQGPFVVRSLTPSALNASAGHTNVGVRAIFSGSVANTFTADQTFTILRDGADVTAEFSFQYLQNSNRSAVEATLRDLAGTGQGISARAATPGAYEIVVDPNLTDTTGGALQTNTQCGNFPLNTRFRIDPADGLDVTPPAASNITYNGMTYGGVIALPVGGQILIESSITDDNGIGYVNLQIVNVTTPGNPLTVYDGPAINNGSASPYQFAYPFALGANTPTGEVYDVILTAVDTDHNTVTIQDQFITVGNMCQFGSGAGSDPSCRGNGACTNNAQCLSGLCNQQTGQCVNLPLIMDVSPWTTAGGSFVSIIGSAFGSTAGTVEFGVDTNADGILEWVPAALASCGQGVSTWNDGYIVVELPRNDAALPDLSTSTVRVTASQGGQFVDTTTNNRGPLPGPNQGWFTKDNSQRTPGLCQVTVDPGQSSPQGGTTGLPGDAVTAVGQSFTNAPAGNQMTFGGVQAQTSNWTDTQINATIPTNLQPGQVGVIVTVNGQGSNGVPFTITGTSTASGPVIEAVSPSSTTAGSYVTARGQRFGTQTGVIHLAPSLNTNCSTGGCTPMNVSLPSACGDTWNDTQVVFEVSPGTPVGTYFVVVENAAGQFSTPQQTDQLVVTAGTPQPSICALSPSAGPAPLPAGSSGLVITGINFTAIPTVYFWGRGAAQGALGTWLQSAVTQPANAVTTIQNVRGSDGNLIDVVTTDIPTQNGYSMQTGPIVLQTASGNVSNEVQYTVSDCRLLDPSLVTAGSQCCTEGPDAGVIVPNGQVCAGQTRGAGYVWRFTTGKIANLPYVVESCSNTGLPSPSPSTLWESGEHACVNAAIVVRFNLPMNITNATVPSSIVRVLTCGTGPTPDCSAGNAVDITSQVQMVHQSGANTSILYLRQVPPQPNMAANTWYHVELLDTLQSSEIVEVLGQSQVRNQSIVATKPCGPGTAYCFDFKTSAQGTQCTLSNVGIEPPAFVARRLGPVLDPRFPVTQATPLNYFLWGQGSQACTALAVDGLGWQWGTAGPNAIAGRATVSPDASHTDSRANAEAFSNTAPQDVVIEARAPAGSTGPLVTLANGLQDLGVSAFGPIAPTDPVSSVADVNNRYGLRPGVIGTTTVRLRVRHANEDPVGTTTGWPASTPGTVQRKTDTIILKGGSYRIWEQRFGWAGQPYNRRLTRFSKLNNAPYVTINIDMRAVSNWATYLPANATILTFPAATPYDPAAQVSDYHIVQDPSGNWLVPDTEFLDDSEYTIVEDQNGCTIYWENVAQTMAPVPIGSCADQSLQLPQTNGPVVFGTGGNTTVNPSRLFDYDGVITHYSVEHADPAQTQPNTLVASSSLIVDLGPPRVTNFFPDCAEACINANLGLDFSRQMSTGQLAGGIRLYRCRDESVCNASSIGNPANLTQVAINMPTALPDMARFAPVNNLQPGTWYLMTAGYTTPIPALEIDPSNTAVMIPSQSEFLVPFASSFRTKNDPTPCIASSVSVLPSPFTAFLIGEQTRYDAYPYGAPDACSVEGQQLNPWGFGWQWQSSVTQVADVSQFVTPARPRPVCTDGCLPAGSDIASDSYDPATPPSMCGNGIVDPGEDCDITDPAAPTTCTLNCLDTADPDTGSSPDFDAANPAAAWCGSGTITAGEDCEPGINGDIAGVTCSNTCLNLGSSLSQAWCDANPTQQINGIPASQSPECAAAASVCGNGLVEAGEACEVIGTTVFVFDPNNPTTPIATNAAGTSCTASCQLENICLTDVPLVHRCDPAQEGCAADCTLQGSSPTSYSSPSLCGDGRTASGLAGIGEFAWCEYSQQEIAAFAPIGENPVQVVSAVGQGTVTNGAQRTQVQATVATVRGAGTAAPTPVAANIAGIGDYALQCGYTSFISRQSNGLVAWLRAEGDTIDSAGSNDAIARGGVTYAPGRFGQAFQFDGVDDYLELPADTSLDFGAGDFTVAMWHRTSEQNIQMNIFGRPGYDITAPPTTGPLNRTEAVMNLNGPQGALSFNMYGPTGAQRALATRIQQVTYDDLWHHVAYVRRGGSIELFVDGTLIGSNINQQITLTTMYGIDQPFYFGLPLELSNFFVGLMDEIQLYNTSLTPIEIQTLASTGALPGSISSGAATSNAGVGTATLNTANGRVNDCPDPRHGVGGNSCCYPRPTRTAEYPVDGAGLSAASAPVCRNTYISVTFDGQIDETSVFNNFTIARGYTAADNVTCSAQGLVDVSPELSPTLAYLDTSSQVAPSSVWQRLWQGVRSLFASLFGRGDANASAFRVPTVTNWCAGAVSAVPEIMHTTDVNDVIVSTTVAIYIDQLLDPNAMYAVLLRGGEAGITDIQGVGIGNPLTTGPNTADSFVFQTGAEVCKLDSIDVAPTSQLYIAPNTTHQFQATTQSTNAQQIVPIVGVYDWIWNWTPLNDTIFTIPATGNNTNVPVVQIASQNVEGERTASAHATVITDVSVQNNHVGRIFTDTSDLRAIFCERPWPAAAVFPFEDAAGNQDAYDLTTRQFTGADIPPLNLGGNNVQFNFSMGYCADAGRSGDPNDDLPYLRVSAPDTSPQSGAHPSIPGGLRKYLFFGDVTGSTDVIGIQIFQNPNHLPLRRWFAEEAQLGSPSNFREVMIDGYTALTNGDNYYINALNEDTNGNLFTNVYLFSINEGASDDMRDVFVQLLSSLQFNVNVTDIGYCSQAGNINAANATISQQCTTDFDCQNAEGTGLTGTNGICANARTKLQRDWDRLERLGRLQERIVNYRTDNNGAVPQLVSGSFIPGQSLSRWASWGTLSNLVGGAEADPINEWSACGLCSQPPGGIPISCGSDAVCVQANAGTCSLIDAASCWNAASSQFVCPATQSVTSYEALSPTTYQLRTPLEYIPLTNPISQALLPEPAQVSTNPICVAPQITSPFGGQSCGDGIVGPGEQCDPPGTTVQGTTGILQSGAQGQCPAQQVALATCDNTCQFSYGQCVPAGTCGDGVVQGGETCDDGALNGQYGQCATDCLSVSAAYCGNWTAQNPIDTTTVVENGVSRTVPLEQCDIADPAYQTGFCDKQSCRGAGRYTVQPATPAVQNLLILSKMAATPNGTVYSIGYLSSANTPPTVVQQVGGSANLGTIPGGQSRNLNDITFADDSNGWIAADYNGDGVVLRTVNGLSWSLIQIQLMTQNPIVGIHAVDAQNVYAIGKREAIRSTDAGVTWSAMTLPTITQNENFNDIHFVDAQRGWIIGAGGLILRTVDGGNTWQRTPSGTTQTLNEVRFSSQLVGMIVGADTLLRTVNGGASWNTVTPPVPATTYSDVDFVDDNMWVIMPDIEVNGNGLHVTFDGGASWLTYSSGLQGASTVNQDLLALDANTILANWTRFGTGPQADQVRLVADIYCQQSTICTAAAQCQGGDACVTTAAPTYHPNQQNSCSFNCQSAGAYCGDGVVDARYEECDDGNNVDTDSCTNICVINATLPAQTPVTIGPSCGDGTVDAGETCDTGAQNGIACTPAYSQSCTYCSADCQNILTVDAQQYCGDAQLQPLSGEVCEALGNGQITTTTLGTIAQCSDVVTAWHNSLEIRGGFSCANQCQTASHNCTLCGFGGALAPFFTPRPQASVLNPIFGSSPSPERDAWAAQMEMSISSVPRVTSGSFETRPWYRPTTLGSSFDSPQLVFSDYTSPTGQINAGSAAGIITDEICNDFYQIYFHHSSAQQSYATSDAYVAHFDGGQLPLSGGQVPVLSDSRRGDFFAYPVGGEQGSVLNEYVVVPPPQPREIRVVIRWTSDEDAQGNPQFVGNLYGNQSTGNTLRRYVDAQLNPTVVADNCTSYIYNQGLGGYYTRDVNICGGTGVPGSGPVGGISFHPTVNLTDTFVQGTSLHTHLLQDGLPYAFFIEPLGSIPGQSLPMAISSFDRSRLVVDIYENRPNQNPETIFGPSQTFEIALGTHSSNPLARYWHAFNITRVGNSYTIDPVNSIETGFSDVQCNLPGHPGC